MINLIYGSSTLSPMSRAELVALLEKARAKNERLGITGMLLYKGGNFLQVIEGEEAVVLELYETIKLDPRHHNIQLIAKRRVAERVFADWQMGFANLDESPNLQLPGYTQYLKEPLDSQHFRDAAFAHTFLQVFKQAMRD